MNKEIKIRWLKGQNNNNNDNNNNNNNNIVDFIKRPYSKQYFAAYTLNRPKKIHQVKIIFKIQ